MTTSLHMAPSTKIIIVEDDENDSFVLLRDMKKAHLDSDVTVFTDGYTAYNHLLETSQPPALLFLDLNLPGMGGIELLKKMREVRRLKKVPVIIMTGSLNPRLESECAMYEVTAFLPKPISFAAFNASVAHLFPERNLEPPEPLPT